jgi:hypothetical protein
MEDPLNGKRYVTRRTQFRVYCRLNLALHCFGALNSSSHHTASHAITINATALSPSPPLLLLHIVLELVTPGVCICLIHSLILYLYVSLLLPFHTIDILSRQTED